MTDTTTPNELQLTIVHQAVNLRQLTQMLVDSNSRVESLGRQFEDREADHATRLEAAHTAHRDEVAGLEARIANLMQQHDAEIRSYRTGVIDSEFSEVAPAPRPYANDAVLSAIDSLDTLFGAMTQRCAILRNGKADAQRFGDQLAEYASALDHACTKLHDELGHAPAMIEHAGDSMAENQTPAPLETTPGLRPPPAITKADLEASAPKQTLTEVLREIGMEVAAVQSAALAMKTIAGRMPPKAEIESQFGSIAAGCEEVMVRILELQKALAKRKVEES